MKSASALLLACLISTLLSCKTEYQKLEEDELSSGKVENELYLGLELGMTKKQFYETCWELNHKGILTNGPSELSVEYSLKMPSDKPAKMRFYPKFHEDKIYLMPIEFSYDGWAPWNENLNADKLLEDTINLFEEWYGKGFIEVSNEDRSQVVFVKMDGNRRVRVFKKHLSSVRAEIVDLPVQKMTE
ncbi:hypothetical protein [Algoriphagus sp. Y33]|uniref:hypothetical protein n=1 Tax=Algoriphagus sp. Y33 TaxID=2772483 RepID=UPI001780EB42|nr:hypothetical protein [Algoriphagus sp. Y33]